MCIILRTKSGNKLGVRPAHTLIMILTKFGMWGGLPGIFHKFEFQDDRSINIGAVGVKSCLFPLTRLIAYARAWKYSQDGERWKHLIETATLQLGVCI